MSIYLSNRDGDGKTNEEGHYRLQTRIFEGFNLYQDDLKVVETSPLSMSVWVSPGDYRLEVAAGYSYTGWVDTNTVVTVSTADPANPRITAIVLYVDKDETTSASPPNNPGITKVLAVDGTPAGSPAAPSGATIQSAVGAGNPYYVLATVLVGAAVTQITNSNITDTRTKMTLNADLLSSNDIKSVIGSLVYPVGSIYFNATVSTNPATLLGFGTWAAFGAGRVPVGYDVSQTEFDTVGETGGEKTHTLSINEMPSHTHQKSNNFKDAGSLADGRFWAKTTGSTSGSAAFTEAAGGDQPHNNLQPYITVYMWKRTA